MPVSTHNLKKGTRIRLDDGQEAVLEDSKRTNLRMMRIGDGPRIDLDVSRIRQAYLDGQWVDVELTAKQRGSIAGMAAVASEFASPTPTPKHRKLIGFSLSKCVNDIALGLIDYDDVVKIIARTRLESPFRIGRTIITYRETAWLDHPKQAAEIARRLFKEGKVEQPRLEGNEPPPPPAENCHWMDSETGQAVTSAELEEARATLEVDRVVGLFGKKRTDPYDLRKYPPPKDKLGIN